MLYKVCPETDCEEISPIAEEVSIVEKLGEENEELRAERVKAYQDWQKNKCRITSGHGPPEEAMPMRKVEIGKEARSKEARSEELVHHQAKLPWRFLPEPNLEDSYLLPETETEKCPIDKDTSKHTAEESDEHVRWIQKLISRIHARDERVYCPYCDMKNHPRWTCIDLDRHRVQGRGRHSCGLRHPFFVLARDATVDLVTLTGQSTRRRKC